MHNHNIKEQYLKQYTCYNVQHSFNRNKKPHQLRKIVFSGENIECAGSPKLPTQIIDKTTQYQILYILKWIFQSTSIILDLFVFSEQKFVRIQMNRKPSLINISGGCLYLIGGNQLHVMNINNINSGTDHRLNLGQCYFSLQPAYFQKQFGIILYSWQEHTGFKFRKFSLNYSENNSGWMTKFASKFWNKKKVDTGYLKIIIPNILGIVFFQDHRTYCLYDLYNMKMIQHTASQLVDWEINKTHNVNIKYHQIARSHGFNDSLLITIGQENKIQVLILHIAYDRQKINEYPLQDQQHPRLTTLTNGYLVDWNRSVLSELITLFLEGKLIDYFPLDDGIISYSQELRNTIPICSFTHYMNPLVKYPILPLEDNIWNQYSTDILINQEQNQQEQFPLHRLVIPNRYSLPFICYSTGAQQFNQIKTKRINHKKLLIDWTRAYKVKKIMSLGSDIIVVRQSSISTFLQIPKFQYLKQKISNKIDTSNESFECISVASSKQQNFQQNSDNSYQFTYERCLKNYQANINENNIFANFIKGFQQKLTNSMNASTQSSLQHKSTIFSKQIICNRIKDIILFYNKTLTNNFTYKKIYEQCFDYKFVNDQELIVHYLNFFAKIINQPAHQIGHNGIDLISSFANKHKISVFIVDETEQAFDVDKQCWNIIKELFEDILPITSLEDQYTSLKINKFVETLVKAPKQYGYDNYLSDIFAYLFKRTPNSLFLSNSIFYALFYIPNQQAQLLKVSHLLQIMNQIKNCTCLSQQQQTLKYIQFYGRLGINKQGLIMMKNFFDEFLKQIEPDRKTNKKYSNPFIQRNDQLGLSRMDIEDMNISDQGTLIIKKLATPLNLINLEKQQQFLRNLNTDEQIQSFFINNLEIELVLAKNIKNQEKTYNQLQQLVCGWILYYRIYIYQFNTLLQSINVNQRTNNNTQNNFSVKLNNTNLFKDTKQKGLVYLNRCQKGFENARHYLQTLKCRQVSDQQLIGWTGQLMIYNKLANSGWIRIVRDVYSQPFIDTEIKLKLICERHLDNIFTDQNLTNQKKLSKLKNIHKYFSRTEMANIISNNGKLKNCYYKQSDEIHAFFGYLPVNNIIKSRQYLNCMNFRNCYIQTQLKLDQ